MRVVALCAALVLVACSNDPTAPLNRDFALSVGETVSVDDAELAVKFVRVVADSRCPDNARCVSAGNGQIEIEVRDDGHASRHMLNTSEGVKEIFVGAHRIQLVALDPGSSTEQSTPSAHYRATLKVTRVDFACTEEARPSFMVGLTDSLTGATSFTDVTIRAVSGAFEDSVVMPVYPAAPYNGPVPLLYERRGTYTVSVSAAGYSTWTKSGVEVSGDQCHVSTVSLTARLVH